MTSAAPADRATHPDDATLGRAETWALIGSQPLAQLSNQALLPTLGDMRADLGLSYAELGWVIASFGIARLLIDLPAGSLGSRFNPRSVLLIALGVSAVSSLAGVLATNGWQMAAVRFCVGAGSSVAQAMLLAWIVGGSGRAGRGRVLARSEALFSLGGLIVPPLSGLLAGTFGWRVAFVLGALGAGIALLAIVLLTRPSSAARAVGQATGKASERADHARWLDLRLGGKVLLAVYLATFIVFFCRNGMLHSVMPLLGVERFALEPFQVGLLFSAINGIGIGAVLLAGRWVDRFGRTQTLLPGLALHTLAQGTLLLVHDPISFIVVGLVQGVACFVNPIPTIVMGDVLPPNLRARGIAMYRAVCDVALLCAPAAMGLALQQGGFDAAEALNLAISVAILAAVLALYASRVRASSH